MTKQRELGRVVDTPKKPQISEQPEEASAPPVPASAPTLPARSPFRPLSWRRRQGQVVDPPSAVERPRTSLVFDASPTTVAAALTKAGAAPDEPSLAWRVGLDSDVEVEAEEGDGEAPLSAG